VLKTFHAVYYKNLEVNIIQGKHNGGVFCMIGMIIRFIVSALVLMLISFVLPGFKVAGFTGALIAAIVIAILGFIVESLLGKKISPQNRGIVGFITAAVVIYFAQFLVPAMNVTWWGALLASLVIGIIDAFVPTELR
jgi:putative membrane protein